MWKWTLARENLKYRPQESNIRDFQYSNLGLYVIDELGYHGPWYGEFDRSHIEKIHEWERKKAEERLSQICEKHMQGCPLYVKHIAIGDPAQEILKLIEKEKVDLVVMSTRGRKAAFKFGSVAEKVLKNTHVPIVTIPISSEK